MLTIRVLVAVGPLILFVSSTIRQMDFKKLSDGDLVYTDHILFDVSAPSKLSCLELCALTECCLSFTYTGKTGSAGRCRGHFAQLMSSDQGTNAPGATTYVRTAQLTNLALSKTATQSSTAFGASATKAVDGDLTTAYHDGSCTHTNEGENSWWQVDLGTDTNICGIVSVLITNRACHAECSDRLRDFDIHVYTEDPATNLSASGALCWHFDGPVSSGGTEELTCHNGPIRGRFVRVTNTPEEVLTLCEVQVMGLSTV